MKASLSASPVALTAELPFADVARGDRPPRALPREQAERLAEAVGKDLQRLLGDTLYQAGMVVVGALYDLPELLQPGLPAVDALTSVYGDAMPPTGFQPSILAIGGQGERFPIPAIAPRREPGAGPLLVLPLVLVAPPAIMDRIGPVLEERLLHTGQAGLDTTRAVQAGFGIQPENLTYATFNDLCALMKVQLDHGGFGPLWNIIEHALFQRPKPHRENLATGNVFLWTGQRVLTTFYTVSQCQLAGCNPAAAVDMEQYLDWLRVQRQYLTGLDGHGIETTIIRPDKRLIFDSPASACELGEDRVLASQDMITEQVPSGTHNGGTNNRLLAVEYRDRRLGPVAFSAGLERPGDKPADLWLYYPVRRPAVEALRRRLAERASGLGAELVWQQADARALAARCQTPRD